MIRFLLLTCVICYAAGISFAQSDFRFRNYTINDGLSQSSVTSIVQDELNSLWIGTQDGLNRFDGNSFEIFVSDDTEGLESSYIRCSELGKNSTVWFGTNNGLTKFDLSKEEFKTYSNKNTSALRIVDLDIDNGNTIWLATEESGLFSFDINKGSFVEHIKSIPSIIRVK